MASARSHQTGSSSCLCCGSLPPPALSVYCCGGQARGHSKRSRTRQSFSSGRLSRSGSSPWAMYTTARAFSRRRTSPQVSLSSLSRDCRLALCFNTLISTAFSLTFAVFHRSGSHSDALPQIIRPDVGCVCVFSLCCSLPVVHSGSLRGDWILGLFVGSSSGEFHAGLAKYGVWMGLVSSIPSHRRVGGVCLGSYRGAPMLIFVQY